MSDLTVRNSKATTVRTIEELVINAIPTDDVTMTTAQPAGMMSTVLDAARDPEIGIEMMTE